MFTTAAGCWVKPWAQIGRERLDVLTAAEPQVWCTAWAWCWRILHPAMVHILTSMAESRWCDFPIAAPYILKFDSNHCAHPQCHWAREQGHGLQTVHGYWDHSHSSTLAVTTVSYAVLVHPLATFHLSFRNAPCYYAYIPCVVGWSWSSWWNAWNATATDTTSTSMGKFSNFNHCLCCWGVLLLLCFWWNVVEAPKLPWGLGPGPSVWRDGTISTER